MSTLADFQICISVPVMLKVCHFKEVKIVTFRQQRKVFEERRCKKMMEFPLIMEVGMNVHVSLGDF